METTPDHLLARLCERLSLGTMTAPPRALAGGFLHRMYALDTTRGRYAVKLLNPHVMVRPDALDNFARAEALEARLEAAGLPILPALPFSGRKMQCLSGQYCYVFPWHSGRALHSGEITPEHAARVGALLARIHAVDRRAEPCPLSSPSVDWDHWIPLSRTVDPELFSLLTRHRGLLYHLQEESAAVRLPDWTAICHQDLDCKNVLWLDGIPCAIDLECLDRGSPYAELLETALSWSSREDGTIDAHHLRAFLSGYAEADGSLPEDWTPLLALNGGRLGWLAYNIQRALGVGCDPREIPLGQRESRQTLRQLVQSADSRGRLLALLNNITKE